MFNKRVLLFLPALGLTACAGDATGAKLSCDYLAGTDVVGFHFEVERVACEVGDDFAPYSLTENVDLVDGIFPGMIGFVEEAPFDAESKHTGADLFPSLEPGCYEVMAAPASSVDADGWTPSADCTVATSDAVEVFSGETTEILLLSQCVGEETGAMDTLVLLNHPPVIEVSIDEKFNYECEAVNVCVTYYDPDDDPMDVVWENLTSTPEFSLTPGDAEVIGFDDGHRIWEQCAEIVTRYTTSYDFSVTVYDQGYEGGVLTYIEDIIGEESHSDLVFPIHTNWVEEPLCFDDDGTLVPVKGSEIIRAEGCSYVSDEDYYCSGAYAVDPAIVQFLCDGTDLIEEALYPACDGGEVEQPCDGIDNDGDGDGDENATLGSEYSWSRAGGANNGAGKVETTSIVYNELDETVTFTTQIKNTTGYTPQGFTVAISDGPNPKGQGNLALVYFDGTTATPTITVYAYNGQNTQNSWYDGSSASGTQAPDPIASSVNDASFVVASSYSYDGTWADMSMTLDVSGINSHTPMYGSNPWEGFLIGDLAGIWYHPSAGLTTSYSGGWLTQWDKSREGWLDDLNMATSSVEICE
jgi:hypothetical protein